MQLPIWAQEIRAKREETIMLHKKLLAKGERPDQRPCGGIFENPDVTAEKLRKRIKQSAQ